MKYFWMGFAFGSISLVFFGGFFGGLSYEISVFGPIIEAMLYALYFPIYCSGSLAYLLTGVPVGMMSSVINPVVALFVFLFIALSNPLFYGCLAWGASRWFDRLKLVN